MAASADCPHVEALAESIHRAAFDVVTYDARGHGTSEGESTLGDDEQHDVAAAVGLARRAHGPGRARRCVDGRGRRGPLRDDRSGARRRRPRFVSVTVEAAAQRPRRARRGHDGTRPGRLLVSHLSGVRLAPKWTNAMPPVGLIAQLEMPVALVHGRQDRFIACCRRGRALCRRARNPAGSRWCRGWAMRSGRTRSSPCGTRSTGRLPSPTPASADILRRSDVVQLAGCSSGAGSLHCNHAVAGTPDHGARTRRSLRGRPRSQAARPAAGDAHRCDRRRGRRAHLHAVARPRRGRRRRHHAVPPLSRR